MKDKTCKDRIKESWKQTQKDWQEHKEDYIYLNESFILCADYVEKGTFSDQKRGYKRIQFSWGGPSDELRVFKTGRGRDKIEYWFLDWFDGAKLDVTNNKIAQEIVSYYNFS